MHHEFTHILNQNQAYDTSFDAVTADGYVNGNWKTISDAEARKKGFVSAYAMSEPKEDFAEMLSIYVTSSATDWQRILDAAGTTGAASISKKMELVANYMMTAWNLDVDKLRSAVLHRANELTSLDLEHLN